MMPITTAFGALILLLVTALAINTTRTRFKTPKDPSPEQRETLRRAMRSHGNNFEHGVPVILLLMFYELSGGQANVLCGIGTVYLLGRLAYTYGFLTNPGNIPQQIGAGLTYLIELLLVGLVLLKLL